MRKASIRNLTKLPVILAIFAVGVLLCAPTSVVVASGPGQSGTTSQVAADAAKLDAAAQRVDALAGAENWPETRVQWRALQEQWLDVEDPFRDLSRSGYANIETEMVRVSDALRPSSPDVATVHGALAMFRGELAPFVQGTVQPSAPAAQSSGSLVDLMAMLDRAISGSERGDALTALAAARDFQNEWLNVEGQVKTRSPEVYRSTEDNMAQAAALLAENPPRTAEAHAVLVRMRSDLEPMVQEPARYGVGDAAIILLREGLEALLVVAALVAFLAKSGHRDKQRWIWGGAAIGILASVVGAFVLQRVFSAATAGANREVVEGITGLVAAAMLLYVSYWLHSKANISARQKYVRAKTMAALTGGGLISLAAISFLAVFREGAETALFYMGIAPAIAVQDLALGLGIGIAGLTVIAVLILVVGVQIPLRPFFLVSSLLLYYLAFKFIGSGIHALQVAGGLTATPAPIPSIDIVGLFPTWETTLPQLTLLLIGVGVALWSLRPAPARVAAAQM